MRTTLRIDDDLMRQLRKRAAEQKVSLTTLCNQLLRQSLTQKPQRRRPFRQRVFSMGQRRVNLDKALSLAAANKDAETIRKLARRK